MRLGDSNSQFPVLSQVNSHGKLSYIINQKFPFLKEIIVSNQNYLPIEIKARSWEIPTNTGKIITIPGVRRSGKSSHFFITHNSLLQRGISKENILFLNLDDERLNFSDGNISLILEAYRELKLL
jgi:predicted AAA+ superfamily ATPase